MEYTELLSQIHINNLQYLAFTLAITMLPGAVLERSSMSCYFVSTTPYSKPFTDDSEVVDKCWHTANQDKQTKVPICVMLWSTEKGMMKRKNK